MMTQETWTRATAAKRYLLELKTLARRIEIKKREKKILMDRAMYGSGKRLDEDRVQTSHEPGASQDLIATAADLGVEIDKDLDKYLHERKEIVDKILKLNDPKLIELLYLKYVNDLNILEISDIMTKSNGALYSYDHLLKLHTKALKSFADLNGIEPEEEDEQGEFLS